MTRISPNPVPPGSEEKPLRIVWAVLIGMLLAGCSPKVSTSVIFRDSIFQVRLQQSIGPDRLPVDRGYDHPAAFTGEEMDRILDSVKIRYRRGFFDKTFSPDRPEVDSAFSAEEIGRMRPGLVKAFGAATPADRIEFVYHHRRGVFATGVSTGVFFVKDGLFNVIIANYRASQNQPDNPPPGNRYQDPMEKLGRRSHQLIPGPHQEIHPSEDPGLQDRWLEIDTKGLLASAPEGPVVGPKPDQTIEEKLETLKHLLDKGLITQDDYEAKKKELLKEY